MLVLKAYIPLKLRAQQLCFSSDPNRSFLSFFRFRSLPSLTPTPITPDSLCLLCFLFLSSLSAF